MKAQPLILIVDDDPNINALLKVVLEDEGYRVATAISAEEVWQRVAERKPDLIMLDLMIPGVDGFQIAEQLRQSPELRDIPLVIVSAIRRSQDRSEVERLGAIDYLDKPFDVNVLGERVRGWLAAGQMQGRSSREGDIQS